ncbi:MAG: PrgI family protein [Candidatus Levybacteria bacterium]|nr:PrgI family protein [Candidatus Levybacteria bacterium]
MEGHPIPQDVTGFQFKLIGSMTVKQFAYLACGSIMAWIFLSLPFFALIKFPLVLFFFLLGFSLAFIPIEGRPMDLLFSYFIKALFTPNQYIYQKTGGQLIPPLAHVSLQQTSKGVMPLPKEKLQAFLKTVPKSKNKLDQKEEVFFDSIFSLFPHPVASKPQPPGTSAKIITVEEEQPEEKTSEDEIKRKAMLEKEALLIKQQLEQAKTQEEEQQTPAISSSAHERVLALEKQLNEVLTQRQQLEQQILSLQKKLNSHKQPLYTPTTAKGETTASARKIPKEMGTKVGVPIVPDDVPNLITGVVKDPRGNVLPNILVEIKDKEGNPARAFKTNGLGQFASSTPLLNGVYTIIFEDLKGEHKFDAIELAANGGVLMPLEIRSSDAREELRKSLFS